MRIKQFLAALTLLGIVLAWTNCQDTPANNSNFNECWNDLRDNTPLSPLEIAELRREAEERFRELIADDQQLVDALDHLRPATLDELLENGPATLMELDCVVNQDLIDSIRKKRDSLHQLIQEQRDSLQDHVPDAYTELQWEIVLSRSLIWTSFIRHLIFSGESFMVLPSALPCPSLEVQVMDATAWLAFFGDRITQNGWDEAVDLATADYLKHLEELSGAPLSQACQNTARTVFQQLANQLKPQYRQALQNWLQRKPNFAQANDADQEAAIDRMMNGLTDEDREAEFEADNLILDIKDRIHELEQELAQLRRQLLHHLIDQLIICQNAANPELHRERVLVVFLRLYEEFVHEGFPRIFEESLPLPQGDMREIIEGILNDESLDLPEHLQDFLRCMQALNWS